jgi:UDP-N-acetylmuramoyl-tripeptide--D-alanyl-D-alanine ligase
MKFFKRHLQKRENIKYTARSITTILFSLLIFLFSFLVIVTLDQIIIVKILLLLLLILSIPIIVLIANIPTLLFRLGYIVEFNNARSKIKEANDLIIIAITGSYGKTTTKNMLYEFLKYNYRVQYIEDNINTPIGIAKWVNSKLSDRTEVLIVEMGAHSKDVIKRSVSITPPDYAIITELGDQHMDRFKTFSNLVETKIGIFSINNSKKYILSDVFKKIDIKTDFSKLKIIEDQNIEIKYDIDKIKVNNLSKGNILLAINVAKDLGVSDKFIKDSLKKIKLPDRRKNILNIKGFTIIDDSYNISLNTAKISLSYAKKYCKENSKSLVVITGGIPESSTDIKKANEDFGKLLSKYNVITILLNTVFLDYILKGLTDKKDIVTKDSMVKALEYVFHSYSKDKYIILMFPELSDLSY